MHLQINFKDPKYGENKMFLAPEEKITIRYGRLQRTPHNKNTAINSIPLKQITSMRLVVLSPDNAICFSCGKETKMALCSECVNEILKRKGR